MKKERIILIVPFLLLFMVGLHLITPKSNKKEVLETKSFWAKKTHNTKTYDVIICGDSRVYRGISPEAIKSILGKLSILNFGYSSGGYSNIMYREINKRINKKSSNKTIILGITPYSLTPRAALNKSLNYQLNIKREERIEQLYFSKTLQFFIPFTFAELLNKADSTAYVDPKIQTFYHNGWVASDFKKPNPEYALASYKTTFINNQVDAKIIDQLCEEITKWYKNDISIYAARIPTTLKMIALEDSLSGFNEEKIKASLTKAGAIWLDFNVDDYFSYDGSHLQEESAIQFSNDLALKIKAHNKKKR